jgi:hypothetical protein
MALREIVINAGFGGFGVSRKAFLKLREMGNKYALEEADIGERWSDGSGPRTEYSDSFLHDIPRDDKDLIKVVKEMGEEANSSVSTLEIVSIPADVEWEIEEYDGLEHIAEAHRRWP